jgi:hypothetical protein
MLMTSASGTVAGLRAVDRDGTALELAMEAARRLLRRRIR